MDTTRPQKSLSFERFASGRACHSSRACQLLTNEHLNFALRKRALAVTDALEKISGVKWRDFIATPSKGEQDVRTEQKNLEKKEPKHRRVEVAISIEE